MFTSTAETRKPEPGTLGSSTGLSSAALGLTAYPQLAMLNSLYKFVNFGAGKRAHQMGEPK